MNEWNNSKFNSQFHHQTMDRIQAEKQEDTNENFQRAGKAIYMQTSNLNTM